MKKIIIIYEFLYKLKKIYYQGKTKNLVNPNSKYVSDIKF